MGMEVCCTLGMLEKQQALELKKAGLTAYNHNLDTSREYYPNIITTRSYDERLETLKHVREAGINVCSGDLVLKVEFGFFLKLVCTDFFIWLYHLDWIGRIGKSTSGKKWKRKDPCLCWTVLFDLPGNFLDKRSSIKIIGATLLYDKISYIPLIGFTSLATWCKN